MEKCILCGSNIDETFLGKIRGTIVKIKINNKNKFYYVCSNCQKEYKDKLKEKVERVFKK